MAEAARSNENSEKRMRLAVRFARSCKGLPKFPLTIIETGHNRLLIVDWKLKPGDASFCVK